MIDSLEIPVAGGDGLLLIGSIAQTLKRLPEIENPAPRSGISPRTISTPPTKLSSVALRVAYSRSSRWTGGQSRGTLGSVTQRVRERYWERHLSGPDVTPVLD
jgi:hypothetical protein